MIQVAACHWGLLMRKVLGVGTARSLQGLGGVFLALHPAFGTPSAHADAAGVHSGAYDDQRDDNGDGDDATAERAKAAE